MSTALKPLSQTNRDTTLDVLRGFALAGVLLTFCVTDVGAAANYKNTLLDEIINWPKYLLIENRMYTMLIIIFGIGFYVQLEKAKQKGVSLVPVFSRRLLGLLIIGFLHAILLSTRDVLMFYGVAGFLLLAVRKASNWQLFFIILFLFLVGIPVAALHQKGFDAFQLNQANNYPDHLKHNWEFFTLYHQIFPIYIEMTFHFMLGYIIARMGLLQKLKTDRRLRRRLMFISLAAAAVLIPFYYFWLINVFGPFIRSLPYMWEKILVVTGFRTVWQLWMLVSVTLYATILISLSTSAKTKNWMTPLAAFGQMTLSNYLIQSLILVPYLLFFDKYSNVPPFNAFIMFIIVLALQLVLSTWWMTRYTMGPFEWLLRSFTYWKWQQMRKRTPSENQIKPFFLSSKTINHL
jgi:uncharacterized protein